MSIRSLDSAGEAEIWEEAFRMLFPGIEPGTEHLSGTFSAVSEPFVLPTVDEPSQSHPTTPVNINGYSSSASTYNFDFGTRPYGDDAPNLLRHDLPSSTSPTFTDILTPPSTTGVAPEIPGWTAPASDQLGVDFDLTDFSASAWDVIFPPDPLYVAKDGPNGHHLLNGLSVAVADGWSASNDTSIGLPAYQTVLMNQITDIDVLNEELGQQFQSTSHKSALRPLHEAPPDFLSPFQTQLQHTTPTTIFAESGGASDSPYRLPAAPAPSPPSTSSGPTARERQTDRVPGVYPSSTALGKRRAEPEQETVGMQGSKRARLVLDGHFEGPAVASVGGFEAAPTASYQQSCLGMPCMGATPSSYGETNEVSLGSLAYSDASAPPPTTPSSQPHMYAVGPDLTPDFLTTEHGIYDQPGREHGVASTSAVSCMQDEFEAVWAFLASNAEALESLLGASAGGHASFITLPTTPATQDDAGEDDYPEDADDHGSPENTSDHYGPGDAHGHHDPRDAAASGAPGPMSQYELGVDLADDGSDRWLSADDCMVVLLLACTRCNARKTKCDEWDVNGCGKCRASGAGCVPRIGDPIVKVRQACLQCRRKKTKCDSRMSAQGKRSICSPCKNREGSCCMYRVDLQEQ